MSRFVFFIAVASNNPTATEKETITKLQQILKEDGSLMYCSLRHIAPDFFHPDTFTCEAPPSPEHSAYINAKIDVFPDELIKEIRSKIATLFPQKTKAALKKELHEEFEKRYQEKLEAALAMLS